MIAKQVDLRSNIKKYFDIAFNGEAVIVPRKKNQNVVIMSENEYKALEKAKRNAEYLEKLAESDEQLARGEVVVKSMKELEEMGLVKELAKDGPDTENPE